MTVIERDGVSLYAERVTGPFRPVAYLGFDVDRPKSVSAIDWLAAIGEARAASYRRLGDVAQELWGRGTFVFQTGRLHDWVAVNLLMEITDWDGQDARKWRLFLEAVGLETATVQERVESFLP